MLATAPVNGSFAHEIHNLPLWKPLESGQVSAIRDALRAHGVLVFRRQSLDENELVRFSANFGELDRIVRTDWAANHPKVIRISNMRDGNGDPIGGLGANELDWHTDQSYMARPATGAVLQMVEMPSEPVDTYWANLKLAWQALDPDLQKRIAELKAVFQYAKRQAGYGEGKLKNSIARQTPDVFHPIVTADPVTGDRALYLDPTTTTGVVGLSDEDAGELLETLNAHATEPRFVYRHRWQIGDVVMWDNSFLLHRRGEFDPAHNRLLKRTTIRLEDCVF